MRVIDDFLTNIEIDAHKTGFEELVSILIAHKDAFVFFDIEGVSLIQENVNADIPYKPPFPNTIIYWTTPEPDKGGKMVIVVLTDYETRHMKFLIFGKPPCGGRWEACGSIDSDETAEWISQPKAPVDVGLLKDFIYNNKEETKQYLSEYANVVRITFQLLNCKNVSTIEHDGFEDMPPHARKHWERKGKPEPVKHYTLAVKVPGEKKPTPFKELIEIEKHKSTKALHVVRGHFATYTEENKLFGKYMGAFWVPAHFRGLKENGVIKKDYRLKMGATSA